MIDPRIILILAAFYGLYWIGDQAVKGVRYTQHKVNHAVVLVVHKIEHPHQHKESK